MNDCLSTGPNYIPHLFNILVRFRSYAVGLVADIEKAFLMVGIDENDRDMLRFLWITNVYEPVPEVVQYRFARLVFGLRPSPAILGATIDHHLKINEATQPRAAKVLKDGLYVDDLVTGGENDDEALDIYKDTKGLMSVGGFNLRKWKSNSDNVMKAINRMESPDGPSASSTSAQSQEPTSRVVTEENEWV